MCHGDAAPRASPVLPPASQTNQSIASSNPSPLIALQAENNRLRVAMVSTAHGPIPPVPLPPPPSSLPLLLPHPQPGLENGPRPRLECREAKCLGDLDAEQARVNRRKGETEPASKLAPHRTPPRFQTSAAVMAPGWSCLLAKTMRMDFFSSSSSSMDMSSSLLMPMRSRSALSTT